MYDLSNKCDTFPNEFLNHYQTLTDRYVDRYACSYAKVKIEFNQ